MCATGTSKGMSTYPERVISKLDAKHITIPFIERYALKSLGNSGKEMHECVTSLELDLLCIREYSKLSTNVASTH